MMDRWVKYVPTKHALTVISLGTHGEAIRYAALKFEKWYIYPAAHTVRLFLVFLFKNMNKVQGDTGMFFYYY